MMSRTAWIVIVVVAVVALALGAGGTLVWVALREAPSAEVQTPAADPATGQPAGSSATTGATVPEAPPEEPASTASPGDVAEPAPEVAVTAESGESYCYVSDAFERDGRRYVVLDYIELGADLGMSEDYEIINNNPRLRTFEVTGDTYLGAFWMAVELYGDSQMEEWDDYSPEGDWLGVPLAWEDLVAAADDGTVNDYSFWFVRVADGQVVRLINTYQD